MVSLVFWMRLKYSVTPTNNLTTLFTFNHISNYFCPLLSNDNILQVLSHVWAVIHFDNIHVDIFTWLDCDSTFPPFYRKCIFLNDILSTSIKISLKFVPKGSINIIPAMVQIMAWRWPGDKPLSEQMMVKLLTHICLTRPQWVNEVTAFSLQYVVPNMMKFV